jgi:hypothetical protein
VKAAALRRKDTLLPAAIVGTPPRRSRPPRRVNARKRSLDKSLHCESPQQSALRGEPAQSVPRLKQPESNIAIEDQDVRIKT